MSDIEAGLANSQLKRIEQSLNKRQKIADRYYKNLDTDFIEMQHVDNKRTHAYHLFPILREMPCDVLGVDWRHNIHEVWRDQIKYKKAVQGNLDPTLLFADWSIVKERTNKILSGVDRPGFIFNLGHGILPGTPEENVERLASHVHNYSL